jgi:phosphoglycerol transferase
MISLAPSYYSWSLHGRPVLLPVKHAAESEQYGLKIRQLVSPVLDSRLPPFRYWNELESNAQFPLEDENRNSRLGVVATAGFLLLLIGLLVAATSSLASEPMLFEYAGRLTLALLLLGTMGGFGSLFSLLVSPEIRAYNRITPFIMFFSLAALAMVADKRLVAAENRQRWAGSEWRVAGAIALVAILGILDESDAAIPLNRHQDDARRLRAKVFPRSWSIVMGIAIAACRCCKR